MAKETRTMVLKLVGSSGGNATHLNYDFIDGETDKEYSWYTTTDVTKNHQYGDMIEVTGTFDEYMDGYVSIEGRVKLNVVDEKVMFTNKLDAMSDAEIIDMSDCLFHANIISDGLYGYPIDIFDDIKEDLGIEKVKKLDQKIGIATRVIIVDGVGYEYSDEWYATVIRGWFKNNHLDANWETYKHIEPTEIGQYEYDKHFN